MTKHPALSLLVLFALGCSPAAEPEPAAEPARPMTSDEDAVVGLGEPLRDEAEPKERSTPPPLDSLYARLATPHHDPKFHDHLEEARILLEGGQRGPAVDALRLALFDAPESAATWELLGLTYLDVGRPGRGVECLEEALRHDGDLPRARAVLARRALDRGDPEGARPHAERLAVLRPGDAESHVLLGRAYLGLAMWDEAIARNRRAVALDPQDVRAYNNLGFAALQRGRTELALQYLEAAMELPAVQAHTFNNLGIAYERAGRPADALGAYARAVELDPGYSTARGNRERVREVVDREVADEVARILAEQARGRGAAPATASRPVDGAPEL